MGRRNDGDGLLAQTPSTYVWDLPAGFPRPRVPADNPMTAAKVELGRRLFYDTRLSANGQQSCATCHEQARAFTDGLEGRREGGPEFHNAGLYTPRRRAPTRA